MNMYETSSSQGVGQSRAFLDFQEKVAKAAVIDRPVLIIGERGTGKELASRRLHYMSRRWDCPLVTLNCAAIPLNLIEAELFGYEKGAFTGAVTARKGRFEQADGGTLFLDEIALLPLPVQEKLLRVVEYGTFERLGSSETLHADVRIIGATNADLKKMCEMGTFKEDLLDRLSFEVLFVPPLRCREEDIMLLANTFALRMAQECSVEFRAFSDNAQRKLVSYQWPGNIRELKNTVERAVYRSQSTVIDDIVFDPFENPFTPKLKEEQDDFSSYDLTELDKARNDLEISFVKRALELCDGNQRKASSVMGISYDSLRGLVRKHKDDLDKRS